MTWDVINNPIKIMKWCKRTNILVNRMREDSGVLTGVMQDFPISVSGSNKRTLRENVFNRFRDHCKKNRLDIESYQLYFIFSV